MPKYIITGGPGAGKTTLLEGLRQCRYPCYAEASRQLIIEEKEKGSDCLPWINLHGFAQKVLQRMSHDFDTALSAPITFFDRGIPDIIAYLQAAGLPVEEIYHKTAEKLRYAPRVFLLPPWQDIYVQDDERWQTFEEAKILDGRLRSAYLHAGYRVVELPLTTIQDRIRFIQNRLQ
ncbi:MAG TPA: AAA family ATPase [Puia sp.]|jgi:predicted ATPase